MDGTWPLVGRAEELEFLEARLSPPDCRGIVLSGPAGVGKSRLADELAGRAGARGWYVVRVVATGSMSTVAFGAMIHLLPEAGIVSGPTELMARLRDRLRSLGRQRQVLLYAEDAHLLDEASTAAVHMLAATGTAFALVTVRSGEPVSDAVSAMWKDGIAARMEVRPLSRPTASEALAAGLDGQVDAATEQRLWDASGGNALFLRELVRAGQDSGRLAPSRGVWSWQGQIALGARLTELIEARLAGLSATDRDVLEELALGEPLGPGLLDPAGAQPLESLERRGWVSVLQDGRRTLVRLAHPLYAEALRAGMGVLRRRSLHRRLADRLAVVGPRRRGDLVRFATWRLDGGGPVDGPTLVAAARQARQAFDHQQAERFARRATEEGGGADAHVLLADALYWQGRHAEAAEALARVPPGDNSPASRTWQAIVTASNLYWGLGDPAGAERVLSAAEAALGTHAAELAAHRAFVIMFNGRPAEALAIARAARAGACARQTRIRALQVVVGALATTGRTGEAIELARTQLRSGDDRTADEPWLSSYVRVGQVVACWLAGRLDDMHDMAGHAYAEATACRADDVRGLWAALLGRALLAKGLAAAARRQLREAGELLRRNDVGSFLPWCLACEAMAAALLGDVADAAALQAESERCRRPTMRTYDSELALAAAWLAAALGERSRARDLALAASGRAAASGQRGLEAAALHDAVRLGARGLRPRLTRLARVTDGAIVQVYAEHCAALARDDAAELRRVAERFAALGATIQAAEAAAQAADACRRTGDTAGHLAAAGRSRALAARCEGAMTPVLRAVHDLPAADLLTAREREVAGLAARGLRNGEIADLLGLSSRTVGNHLNHVYGKLGITRDDLATLFTS